MFMPSKGYELPDYVKDRLNREYMGTVSEGKSNESGSFKEMDAIYQTPTRPHLLPPHPKGGKTPDTGRAKASLDVVYASRMQKERHPEGAADANDGGLRLDKRFMQRPQFRNALIMHPLPRVDEIDYALDENPRSIYFKQAAYGIPVRMALLATLLGVSQPQAQAHYGSFAYPVTYPPYKSDAGIRCPNPTCVSNNETAYIVPEFFRVDENPTLLRCRYCRRDTRGRSRRQRQDQGISQGRSSPLPDGSAAATSSTSNLLSRLPASATDPDTASPTAKWRMKISVTLNNPSNNSDRPAWLVLEDGSFLPGDVLRRRLRRPRRGSL